MSSRTLGRLLLVPLVLAATALFGVAPASAATFTVTKTADTADGTCSATDCSLREAIIAANAAAGADTVVVPPGTYLLTINMAGQDDASAEGDLDITDDVTLTGAGVSTTVVDGNGSMLEDHVFQIKGPAKATISGFTVRGGNATFAGPGTRDDGGGIFVDDDPSDATLFLSDTFVTANHADDFAGGVDVDAIATLTNVTIAGNTADDGAGGLEVEGTATITNVTVSANRAGDEGGGIAMYGDSLTINNSTIIGNTADADNDDDGDGGGIFAGDPVVIRNTIIAANIDASSPGTVHPDCSTDPGDLTSQGHNLVQVPGLCSFTAAGDLTGVSPNVAPLADNGGPVATHALQPGSPAIDAGDPATPGSGATACAGTDARGVTRTGACDIGAYELVVCKGTVVNRLGTEGSDTLIGTAGTDGFLAFGGNDVARGLAGKDALCLGSGKDVGAGGGGKDRLFGEGGKDRLKGQGGNDRMVGGPAKDTCVGGPGKKDKARQCEVTKTIP